MPATDHSLEIERTREIVSAAAKLISAEDVLPMPADGDLEGSDSVLQTTRQALLQALDGGSELTGEVRQVEAAALVLGTVAVEADVKDALIRRRADVALGVREALSTLRNATSASAVAERAPIEARQIGFRRALFSKIEHGTWMARSAFAVDDPGFADEIVAIGRANPRRLNGPLIESEMVRRGTPVVVADPQSNPRVHTEFIRYTRTTSYVAAPITAWGMPVAMLHADRNTDCAVDDFDRYILGTYAEGLGMAIERAQLMERLRAVRQATSDYLAGVHAIADDFTADVLGAAELSLEARSELSRAQAVLPPAEGGERLTPREWDVLRNLASGKTNAQIATGLFVTEGTVKSHVKHILRKLGATNRTEAVARYHRLVAAAGPARAG
ncbi:DNA-binding CsgD family transcriptional regulator [Mycolicibacterium sp. BK556]|uniref:LuxR C-terminal-related transcriptional regulator n=1 Tax=unclassified Mycolicibacterium TaxID=2636767 RepID=UPI0016108E0D|nr:MULTISPECIES: LuxR C-terminal-related transcriptional regulator [unclassified Mycolicibacterium]MBB3605981.1 DNA-binding CsgD family transcriptional regulator [Mycolicibacterium sp. BK556]MBB3632558.1 DNA-binding CsgD family transcriptional regulator [Mycolicibacterium sp. BK607]